MGNEPILAGLTAASGASMTEREKAEDIMSFFLFGAAGLLSLVLTAYLIYVGAHWEGCAGAGLFTVLFLYLAFSSTPIGEQPVPQAAKKAPPPVPARPSGNFAREERFKGRPQ